MKYYYYKLVKKVNLFIILLLRKKNYIYLSLLLIKTKCALKTKNNYVSNPAINKKHKKGKKE